MTPDTKQKNPPEESGRKEPSVVWRDFLRSFCKLWWLAAVLAVLFGVSTLAIAVKAYQPMYKAEATFTVETYTTQGGYTFFYDNQTASQMALTFPFLLDSDLLLDRVKADLGVEFLSGTPSAEVIENSNLFTLSVTSYDPQAAYDILLSLVKNYPAVAEYVIGRTQLNMIDHPEFPEEPYNSTQYLRSSATGCMGGFLIGLMVILIHALLRNTVRKETDITQKLHSTCLGSIPLVTPKRNRKMQNLSIHNTKVGSPFKESLRGLALQTTRVMEDKKILLITATTSAEGTSTVAQSLAQVLSDQGKRVVLIDGDFSHPGIGGTGFEQYLLGNSSVQEVTCQMVAGSVCLLRCDRPLTPREQSMVAEPLAKLLTALREKADYVLLDAPPCENLEQVAFLAEQAEGILYVIRQDHAKLPNIMNCFEDLDQFEARILGCVLNGIRSGITGYGYGYGYGYSYGKGYRYGRYGNYGYGDKKGGKYAAEKEGKQ